MIRKNLIALGFAAAAAFAAPSVAGTVDCDVDSDYDLRVEAGGFTFSREGASPATVTLRDGALYLDGQRQALSAADAERIARIEDELESLLPEVKAIALEGVDIAYRAVVHVAATFVDDADKLDALIERLAESRVALEHQVERAIHEGPLDEREFARMIESTVESLVPTMVGEVTGQAIALALSGDENRIKEFEARVERMERTIEEQVEERAEALERRAEGLCPRIAELDRIENALELRLADGQPLDLVRL